MELKRRFWRFSLKNLLILLYFGGFAIFLSIGLRPAEAKNYEISAEVNIPAINLRSDVTALGVKDHRLETPDYIVGSFSRFENKVLLIGHSSTVFANLKNLKVGDELIYDDAKYVVIRQEIVEKPKIDMDEILANARKKTLVLMTCAGESVGVKDATHRLIITAEAE